MGFNEYAIRKLEEKLIELMGEEEYVKFSIQIARVGFRKEIEGMADSEFKEFAIKNFDYITR